MLVCLSFSSQTPTGRTRCQYLNLYALSNANNVSFECRCVCPCVQCLKTHIPTLSRLLRSIVHQYPLKCRYSSSCLSVCMHAAFCFSYVYLGCPRLVSFTTLVQTKISQKYLMDFHEMWSTHFCSPQEEMQYLW